MRYSQGFKESIVKKVLPPENEAGAEVSRETGIAACMIYQWKRAARDGRLTDTGGELRQELAETKKKLKEKERGNSK